MPIDFAIILGVVQALTEFLPVSSSGHLVLFQLLAGQYFGVGKTPLTFDVLVHGATLLVTLVYLRQELLFLLCRGLKRDEEGRAARKLIGLLLLGSVPAAVVGLGFEAAIEELFHSLSSVAFGFLLTTLVLTVAHMKGLSEKALTEGGGLSWPMPTLWQAFLIGCAQAVAIIPGVSRSGSTISAALVLGLPTETALRFSFLLSLPAIGGALLLKVGDLTALPSGDWAGYSAGFLASFVAGWFALKLLVFVTRELKLVYFAAYTFLLGIGLVFLAP